MESPRSWQEEFGLIPRFPRIPETEISKLLETVHEQNVYLRETDDCAEIVVQLNTGTANFPKKVKRWLRETRASRRRAFKKILLKAVQGSDSTPWVQLADASIAAYRNTWPTSFNSTFRNHFHPISDKWLAQVESCAQMPVLAIGRKGRRGYPQAAMVDLQKRYEKWLTRCESLHAAAIRAASKFRRDDLRRRAIWDEMKAIIYGKLGDDAIFGGAAFKKIPYAGGHAKLHDPKSWSPRQLAVSLTSSEFGLFYKSAEKKIRPSKKRLRITVF
jgi:hypothetical protein